MKDAPEDPPEDEDPVIHPDDDGSYEEDEYVSDEEMDREAQDHFSY